MIQEPQRLQKAAATRQALADRVAELSDRAYNRETEIQIQELKQTVYGREKSWQELFERRDKT